MSSEDKVLVCRDCQTEFVHTAADQARYADLGFAHPPKRCPACREKRRAERAAKQPAASTEPGNTKVSSAGRTAGRRAERGPQAGGRRPGGQRPRARTSGGGGGERSKSRELYDIVCAECGTSAKVPFKPTQGLPVYCRDCYQSKRGPKAPPPAAGEGPADTE